MYCCFDSLLLMKACILHVLSIMENCKHIKVEKMVLSPNSHHPSLMIINFGNIISPFLSSPWSTDYFQPNPKHHIILVCVFKRFGVLRYIVTILLSHCKKMSCNSIMSSWERKEEYFLNVSKYPVTVWCFWVDSHLF